MTPKKTDYVRGTNGAHLRITEVLPSGEVKVSTGDTLRLKPDPVPQAQAGLPPYQRLWEIDES